VTLNTIGRTGRYEFGLGACGYCTSLAVIAGSVSLILFDLLASLNNSTS